MQTADHVDLWQHGLGRSYLERGLSLASAASPTPADAPLGLRNERVLAWRERVFGRTVRCVAQCPECGTHVEAEFEPHFSPAPAEHEVHEVSAGGVTLRFRLPDSLDLAYISRFDDEEEAMQALIARCVRDVRWDEGRRPEDRLPEAAVRALSARMEELDPAACPRVRLECPGCGHGWACFFEVAEFAWRELARLARRALLDVHELAQAYGWTEAEVFALPPARRRMYLEMVRA